ncbi:galactoside 2-alpha-L-fucosyltransferase 3-like [Photinus pyralis]|uniref:galactoside 2-alpha-L-fucosyltransferase 3-like n=1 Tax=Photinus pyralis TaxID=7054 RepID=UPI0012673D46|nr:galactoside 2-alpha-L-fucosyltransferase 3-like [Photinus pyralis]
MGVTLKMVILAVFLISSVTWFLYIQFFLLRPATSSYASPTKRYIDLEKKVCSNPKLKEKKSWAKQQCPKNGIVTSATEGRLGNKMWSYISVWAVARAVGLDPYVPRCLRSPLDQIFDRLSVPLIEEISHCPFDEKNVVNSLDSWQHMNQSIVIPSFAFQQKLSVRWAQDIRCEFRFKKELINKSQNILRLASQKRTNCTFVSVHIRRTDYQAYLKRKYSIRLANTSFYYSAMKYFESKYSSVVFIISSDDPNWCSKTFKEKNNVYITGTRVSPALDLAIMSSCNHSIIDYGTFGEWGAILAGGETIFYNIGRPHSTNDFANNMPEWRGRV